MNPRRRGTLLLAFGSLLGMAGAFESTGDAVLDTTRLVYKRRFALDGQLRSRWVTLSAEYTPGFDRPLAQYRNGDTTHETPPEGVWLRADIPVTARTDLAATFDAYNAYPDRYETFARGPRAALTTLGVASTWHASDGVTLRGVFEAQNVTRNRPTGQFTTQLLIEY